MGLWLAVSWQMTPLATVCAAIQKDRFASFISLATALINGSHGMAFALKLSLIGLFLGDCLIEIVICGEAVFAVALVNMGGFIVGATVAHMVELFARRNYAEKVRGQVQEMEERRLGGRLATRGRQLEERNEQLQTSNERLLGLEQRNEQLQTSNERLRYDVQRRGHPLDNDDERSAICRGLQSHPGLPYLPADCTDSSETESTAPSDALPPSLPPGPPSSSSSNATKSRKSSKSSQSNKSNKAGTFSTSGASSSTAEAPSSQAGQSTVPPPSWAELAYRRHYAELAAKSATEQRVPSGAQSSIAGKSAAPPLTWPEFYEALRKTKLYYAENAARLAAEPEEALAPPIARAASSQQRHAESAGAAWLTPGQERCMHFMQPELTADLEELRDMAEVAEMAEEEVFAALVALINK